MMKFFRSILLSILFSTGVIPITLNIATAQQRNIDALTKKFDLHRKQILQEKIYLHIDRPSYLTGETLWFKIYLTDATLHKPATVSKVAYVEFIDSNNVAVLQTKVEINDGTGEGSLYLPATLNSGNYMVRAYTNVMKNFSAEFYFHKSISVVNTFKSLENESKTSAPIYDAQFFPEGGNLVAGIKSKVAFRVTESSGNGIDFNGFVLDEQNDTIVSFSPRHFGIGYFFFIPHHDKQYHAMIRDRAGKIQKFNLPIVLNSGYTMHVSDSSADNIRLTIKAISNDASVIPGAYLFVHSRNIIVRAEFQNLRQGSAEFVINKKDLPDGISHVTVFDASMKPACERLYFKQPENNLVITAKSNQTQYDSRRLVKIDLNTTFKQEPKKSDVSVSVFKIDSLPSSTGNMVNYFWLTSDLKGTIESPEFYFSSSTETKEAVDNLLLTHGWRRFVWDDILSGKEKSFEFIPEYRGHIIQGNVSKQDGTTASGIMTYLSSPSKIINLYPSRSNKDGAVQFEMRNFYGRAKIIAQTNPKKDSVYSITIKSPFSDKFSSQRIPSFKLSPEIKNQLLNRSVAMQVQDIYFANEFANLKSNSIDSSAFYNKADETYLLDAYTRFPVMEEVLREYVPGVLVRKHKDGFHFILLDNINKSVFRDSPLLLVDGVPVFDEDEIMDFSPLNVKKLEVVTRRWFLGPLNFSGIVSFTTYNGDLSGFQLNPKSVTLNYEGLQLQREFYTPKYENKRERDSRMPDQRYLLFWNPHVITEADGHQQVEFYTGDISGEYKIVVEGITKDGAIGTTSSTFTVKDLNN